MGEPRAEFVRAHTCLSHVDLVPEISLYQATEPMGLWELTEGEYHSDQPPPFWAFPWAGGQGLARYVLDHPLTVRGRDVLDLASGSGLVAIAAARAGAALVRAVDVDPTAVAAIQLNAEANGVTVLARLCDVLDSDHADARVVTAGDVFYSEAMAGRVLRFLRGAARDGALILVGDPDRAFLPRAHLRRLAAYDVPVREALEGTTVRRSTVWELPRPQRRPPEGPRAGDQGP